MGGFVLAGLLPNPGDTETPVAVRSSGSSKKRLISGHPDKKSAEIFGEFLKHLLFGVERGGAGPMNFSFFR